MPTLLALSLASALGGLARYLLGGVIARRGGAFPWETLIVNVSFRLIEDGAHLLAFANLVGSLLLGLVAVYGGIVPGRAVS